MSFFLPHGFTAIPHREIMLIFDRRVNPEQFVNHRHQLSSFWTLLTLAKKLACPLIGDAYFEKYLLITDYAIVAQDRQGDPRGFILTREFADRHGKGVEIGLVCSSAPSVGELLIRMVEQRAHDLQLQIVRLYALDEVIGYYRKLGFMNGWDGTERQEYARQFAETRREPEEFLKLLKRNKDALWTPSDGEWTYPMTRIVTGSRPVDVVKHIRRAKRASPYYKRR